MRAACFMLLTGICGLVGCSGEEKPPSTSPESVTLRDVGKEAGEALDTGASFLSQQKTAYEATVRKKLKDIDGRLAELKEKALKAGPQVKARVEESIEALAEKKAAAQRKLEQLTAAGDEAWRELSKGVDAAIGELEAGVESAASSEL